MKKLLLTIPALFACINVLAQEPVKPLPTEAYIAELDSISAELYNQEEWVKAADVIGQQLDAIQALRGESDSMYIANVNAQAYCYYKSRRLPKAVETGKKAVELYEKYVSREDETYAVYLNRLSTYYVASSQFQEAVQTAEKALEIYEKLNKNDDDGYLGDILMHAAEAYYAAGQPDKAINADLRSLNIMKKWYGEHSDEYIGELGYLKRYYEANEELKKAEDVQARIDKLEEEAENGVADLPAEDLELTSAELCREYHPEMLRCCSYLFNRYITAPQLAQACNFVAKWALVSDEVEVASGDVENKLMTDNDTKIFFIYYLAGCSEYALLTGEPTFCREMYHYAWAKILNWYNANREKDVIRKIKLFEDLLKANQKGKLEATIDKMYPETGKSQPKANVTYKF